MEYILIMTLAGSGMALLYLIFERGFQSGHFEKQKYFFLKICVLFYLVRFYF